MSNNRYTLAMVDEEKGSPVHTAANSTSPKAAAKRSAGWKAAVTGALAFGAIFAISGGSLQSKLDQRATDSRVLQETTADAKAKTMVPVVWDEDNSATIEFCEVGNQTYGYRLPGDEDCQAAGLVVRMKPGQDYKIVLHNAARERTNVHTHGLHISGAGNADDVTRYVDPDMCLTYFYSVPSDHMGGTHWMHPHLHGSTQKQVMGGAFAMLIIEETDGVLENVEEEKDRENIQQWMNNELLLIAARAGTSDAFVSNGGNTHTTFDMVADEWYRMRILTIQENGKRVPIKFPEQCEVHAVAFDGTWRFATPELDVQRELNPTGAGRTDLAIRCGPLGQYPVAFNDDEQYIVTLNVAPGVKTNASPFLIGGGQWEPARPYYLRDLTEGDASIGDFETFDILLDQRTISGFSYDDEIPAIVLDYNTLQEWTIINSDVHPFHLHVFHMQTFGCQGHEDGQYYDTIVETTPSGDCRVRYHIIDFGERVTLHCHNTGHEDQGMMIWYDAIGGPLQSSSDRGEYQCPAN